MTVTIERPATQTEAAPPAAPQAWTPALLAQAVLFQISTFPETHDQTNWEEIYECRTTRCVAGWAWHFVKNGEPWWGPLGPNTAMEQLGLSREAANWLFDGGRPTEQVHAALKVIADGKPLDLKAIREIGPWCSCLACVLP